MSGGEYVALAYGAVFVFVLVYVAIIAAKLLRLQQLVRDVLHERGRTEGSSTRTPDYAEGVRSAGTRGGEQASQ